MGTREPALRRLERPTGEVQPPGDDSDARLGAWLREDPHTAAPALYDRFQSDVNRWVWRLLGADQDHHDVVQQVFVRVIRSAKRLREVDRLAAWMHAVTVNTVYGELRRREIRRLFVRQSDPAPFHPDLVREVEMRDLLLRAKAIIDKIPAKERIVFVLHIVEGESLHEIAAILGYSHATAKRRLGAANRRFQALLSRDPELSRVLSKLREP
jgi:RNA polymerase sigma-70 factor (ECF subfamily)